ncbi:MAG: hypothetical protein AAF346_22640 [Pseudomonadota bacterium]
MGTIRLVTCCFVIAFASLAGLTAPVGASDLIHREVLKRVDLTGSDKTEVIVTRGIIAPGGRVPRHSHHGDEFVYVTEVEQPVFPDARRSNSRRVKRFTSRAARSMAASR